MFTQTRIQAVFDARRWPSVAAALLLTLSASAQPITSGHLNVGALGTNAGSQLTFANAAAFVSGSGYVQMDPVTSGTYAGYYGSGPTLTALPQTVAFGGPNASAPSFGSFIEFNMTLQSAPEGGSFAFWDSGVLVPSVSLSSIGAVSQLFDLSGGAENPNAGLPGADPYGHLHGRRFTATVAGEYVIGFQAFDTSLNGAQHTPSSMLSVRFLAVPEPSSVVLLASGGALAGMWRMRSRRNQ